MTADSDSEAVVDRKILLEHLQVANRHVAESEHRIARQQRLIDKLQAKQQATSTAEWFLGYLRASRVLHLVSRSRLQEELAQLDAESRTN